ncbi:MAG TPA: diaminopimelate epimerase [candidate division Zixibacteria bacterium]|nr:diaminopimelate epimerase [candidate division Zixibacteria bacterium]
MQVHFIKYQALGNDFLVINRSDLRFPAMRRGEFARAICDRNRGVGADGILLLTASRRADISIDLYNSDGSPAEKSGNGLRSVVFHLHRNDRRRRQFSLEMGGEVHQARVISCRRHGAMIRTELGQPTFEAKAVPVKVRSRYLINAPLKLGGVSIPVTCLSVGNPHTVLLVDNFDFEWEELGAAIEFDSHFPNQTNVEFVKVISRSCIQVADWERGAGATGSSGTGAAASVCACVMLGVADRKCEVQFENGSLHVDWKKTGDIIELVGPVEIATSGEFYY